MARCRYRDTDGIVRVVERRGPPGDKHGKLAEDALLEALSARRPPDQADIGHETTLMSLVDRHIARLREDGRAARTLDTYEDVARRLAKKISGVRVGEATPARLDAALRAMRTTHGPTMARQARTILKGGLQLAVLANVIGTNPVRDVETIRSKAKPKGATAVEPEQLRELLQGIAADEYCLKTDLADPIILFMATGLRISELLALRWVDFDEAAGTVVVTGKVVRVRGDGLVRVEETKTEAGRRTVPLPKFAVRMLQARRLKPYVGELDTIFASTAGTLRDPDNFRKQWRLVREALGVPESTTHSFRKSVATMIDDEGLSARIGADHLGHAQVSMTQDRYMSRGKVHSEVAGLLDRVLDDYSGTPS